MQQEIFADRRRNSMKELDVASSIDPDVRMIVRYLEGDQHAFDDIFHKYQTYVYNIILGIIGTDDEARDTTQEVFLQVHRSLRTFRFQSQFATWLYRIAVNRAMDAARAKKRRNWFSFEQTPKETPSPKPSPEEGAIEESERKSIRDLLAIVPIQHRDVLVLKYYQEMSIEEIAETLGCSVTAAKVRLYRARQYFKERYTAIHENE
jgi:RNA polymerase sigma-70 factor (ECF subfamily)